MQAQRLLAEARMRTSPQPRRMTREEITSMVNALHDVMNVLAQADPIDKAEIYAQLDLKLIYQPQERKVIAQARPLDSMYVRTCPRGEPTDKPMAGVR